MAISCKELKDMLISLGYEKQIDQKYVKHFEKVDASITVDFDNKKIIYPENKGFKITRRTTCNFSSNENFVVLECVSRLFDKGYRPESIEIEREWSLGHNKKSGFADIVVSNTDGKTLFIIECKTYGNEYKKEVKNLKNDGDQLFSYLQQDRNCKWLILYASDYIDGKIVYDTESISCIDDENIKNVAKKDTYIKIFENAHTVEELFEVWKETYENRFSGDVIFRDDSVPYQIGVKPLRKKNLIDFAKTNIFYLKNNRFIV